MGADDRALAIPPAERIRELMPNCSAFFRQVSDLVGPAHVSACVRAGLALAMATAAGDQVLVEEIHRECRRRGISPASARENGYIIGVPPEKAP